MPVVTLKLFPPAVDPLDHPPVAEMRRMLTAMAEDHGATLTTFAVDRGVVLFSVDSERRAADFCEFVAETTGRPAEVVADPAAFWEQTRELPDENREG